MDPFAYEVWIMVAARALLREWRQQDPVVDLGVKQGEGMVRGRSLKSRDRHPSILPPCQPLVHRISHVLPINTRHPLPLLTCRSL